MDGEFRLLVDRDKSSLSTCRESRACKLLTYLLNVDRAVAVVKRISVHDDGHADS